MTKIFLTGGTGFIGTALNSALNRLGFEVTALVRDGSDATLLEAAGSQVVRGSILDTDLLKSCCQAADGVFHLAGVISHRESEAAEMEAVNVNGTRAIIDALAGRSAKLIYISSVAAIGALFQPGTPLTENAEFNLSQMHLPYFDTKYRGEQLVQSAVRDMELNATILNPSTVFGPRDGLKGSRAAHVKAIRGKLLGCPVGGVSIASLDAVVEAMIAAFRVGRRGERYILAGENITIVQMFQILAAFGRVKAPVEIPTRLLEFAAAFLSPLSRLGIEPPLNKIAVRTATLYHWFNSEKARRELNYCPLPAAEALELSAKWIINELLKEQVGKIK